MKVQTYAWSGTHAQYPRRGRAKADPNILCEYAMAWGKAMLERCLGSGQSFGMLLPGGLPKGKRGVEWVGALAGRHPQPPLFPRPLLKGGMLHASISGQSITRPEAESIVPRAGLPSAVPSLLCCSSVQR